MLRAGKIIGEGGQGCVISPAWDSKNANEVTKIASRSTTLKETEISRILRAVDPQQMYGIYALGNATCGPLDPARLSKERIVAKENDSASKCANLAARSKTRKDVCYANYPKYVQDLDPSGSVPKLTKEQGAQGILHIWKALAFLHDNHVIHGDIKGPNMAIVNLRGELTFVFADWGWSAQTNTLANASEALANMKSVANEYIAYHYNNSSNGIWSPKLVSENPKTLKGIRNLLEFNDVFSLAYAMIDFVKFCERYDLISEERGDALFHHPAYRPASN